MTMEPVFKDFLGVEAPADDQLRAKWEHARMGFAANLPIKLDDANLTTANVLVNALITYKEEPEGEDYWQQPMETLNLKTGDCEDFAILKYRLLMEYYPEEQMRLIIGNIKSLSVPSGLKPHAWLAVYSSGWKVLDSMFPQIITPDDYINWVPVAEIHLDSVRILGKEFRIADLLPPVSTKH
jgi:predicted transglutaminase-like cysteine proteinase